MATQALLEFIFIVFACITLLIGINAAKSKAAGRVLFPATFVTGIASISYFSMASGGGWVIAPDCRFVKTGTLASSRESLVVVLSLSISSSLTA